MINTFRQSFIHEKIDLLFVSIGEKKYALTKSGERERLNNLKAVFLKAKMMRCVSEGTSSEISINEFIEQINQIKRLIEDA